ncbi:MAG: transporter substrate-binding domain-containing protein [Clostridiales bacterium]|nr:transporter substrate-binding domain-containing protein [Clostridiales bacterium]
MKYFAGFLAVVLCFGALAGCAKTNNNDGARAQLRVGLECDYAPFNWTQNDDSNGAVPIESGNYAGGYDVEIAKALAEGLDMDLVIVKTDWDGLLPSLTSGKIDVIIAGMSPTAERKESIDFSDNYYISDLVIVVSKDGPFASADCLDEFAGAKITAQQSTFHYTVIDQIEGVDKQTAMTDFPTMIMALNSGRIDGYISERPGAISAALANPNLTYIAFDEALGFTYTLDEVAIAVGLKKGSDLLARINEILAGISEAARQQMMENAIKNQPAG